MKIGLQIIAIILVFIIVTIRDIYSEIHRFFFNLGFYRRKDCAHLIQPQTFSELVYSLLLLCQLVMQTAVVVSY